MADLTPQDQENYINLKKAVIALKNIIPDALTTLKQLIQAVLAKLPEKVKTSAELEELAEKVDSYLVVQSLLLESLTNEQQKTEIAQASQEVSNQNKLLKASLEDLDDADLSALDDLNPFCMDALFLSSITGKAKTRTQQLLDGFAPNLKDKDIQNLTDAWGAAIQKFAEDSRKDGGKNTDPVRPGKPDTIARFFCIHEELEALYDRLSTLVA